MTLNDLEIITRSDSTHTMSMADSMTICVETPRIDIWCSLEKELTKLIYMNP